MDIVIIDPGHGGTAAVGRSSPHGVRGPGGTLEKHVTLELAQQVARHLGQGARLTRSADVNLPLAERAALARRQGARVFLSLHANEGPPGRRGAETYVHPRAVEDSRVLAQAVQQSLARYGSPDRGVREARMEVLRPEHHAPHTAACLLEVDYLSDAEGERGLGASGSLERLGAAIAQGVRGYLERSRGAPAYGLALPRRYGFRSALAASLVRVGGAANAADATLVSTELDKLPESTLQALEVLGSRVVVCRTSITDYVTRLRGVQPRGWPPGSTWDSVPGVNLSDSKEVVVATIGHGTSAGAHVPRTGEGHGSFNLVLHETMHGVDLNGQMVSRSSGSRFVAARNTDLATLSTYEQQAGNAGREETYAESGARYFGGDATDASRHPTLHSYWQSHIPGPSSEMDA